MTGFGRGKKRARAEYRKFVREGIKEKNETPLKEVYGQAMLGGDDFIKKIQHMIRAKSIGSEITGRKRLQGFPDTKEIVNLVGEVFDTSEEEIKRKGSRSAARKAAIYLMQRYSGLSISEIGELFGGIHFSAVSKISSRLKGEMAADKRLFRKVEQVESKIKA